VLRLSPARDQQQGETRLLRRLAHLEFRARDKCGIDILLGPIHVDNQHEIERLDPERMIMGGHGRTLYRANAILASNPDTQV